MHYGSSEEEDSEEEARAQDRRGEEIDGQEDGYRPSQDGQEEINCKGAGLVPAPSLFLLKNNRLSKARDRQRLSRFPFPQSAIRSPSVRAGPRPLLERHRIELTIVAVIGSSELG
jgi:hypothetical protein